MGSYGKAIGASPDNGNIDGGSHDWPSEHERDGQQNQDCVEAANAQRKHDEGAVYAIGSN
jgi:hypothetical protein